jgi:hypothetical protein
MVKPEAQSLNQHLVTLVKLLTDQTAMNHQSKKPSRDIFIWFLFKNEKKIYKIFLKME